MKVTLERVKDIAKTLPVGYYVGREVKVDIDPYSSYSGYDVMNDEISLSLDNINLALRNIKDATDEQVESDVRTLLYHEVSHAMLTPKNLTRTYALNVVEDERIESLLKDYYHGVDFKSFTQRCCPDEEDAEDSADNAFFDLVRFGKGPQVFLDELNKILWKYKDLNRNSDSYYVNLYRSRVHALYDTFVDWYKNQKNSKGSDSSNDSNGGSRESQGQGKRSSILDKLLGRDNKGQVKNPSQKESDEIRDKIQDRCYGYSDEEKNEDAPPSFSENGSLGDIKNSKESEEDNPSATKGHSITKVPAAFTEIVNKYVDKDLIVEFERIFSQSSKIKKMNSSAINTYSGVFDPRSVVRDDYKYFLQKNRGGSAKAYSKVHLNLFLDRSGSFCSSVQVANEILYALCHIERRYPDFDFTLISCGVGERIESRKNMEHSAYDGTSISLKIFDTFKEVQKRDAVNYNIVLYDGLAYDHEKKGANCSARNFAAFNTSNTLIITDPSNSSAMKYCPSARVVISEKYTDELKSNLIKMLEILTK